MFTQPPIDGMRVMFGHVLLKGRRTGTIVHADVVNLAGSGVAVDFLPEDGPKNPPGKIIWGCYYFENDTFKSIPGSKWQYCFPLLKDGKIQLGEITEAAKTVIAERQKRIRRFFGPILDEEKEKYRLFTTL